MATPLAMLSKRTREDDFASAIVHETHKAGFPFWAEVQQSRFGPATVLVAHYDFLNSFSMAEITWIDNMAKGVAAKIGYRLVQTLQNQRYVLEAEDAEIVIDDDRPAWRCPRRFKSKEAYERTLVAMSDYLDRSVEELRLMAYSDQSFDE